MTHGEGRSPVRVRQGHVEWVAQRLGERDQAIVGSVARLRLVTGTQLERLHFHDLALSARARIRRRVLARLVSWRVLMTLERRIGGVRAGSSGLVFALDSAGQRLAQLNGDGVQHVVRRAEEPSTVLADHTLAVSELYVSLVELARTEGLAVAAFESEPHCWRPNGMGGWLKPDAYLLMAADGYADAWWLEQDQGSEHLPTIRRKLRAYLDFAQRGQVGPTGVMPRVLISVLDERRKSAIETLIHHLPDPATKLLHVTTAPHAARYLLRILRQ